MEKRNLILFFLTALLAAACAQTETPNPTVLPEATPAGKITEDSSENPGSVEDYNKEYFSNGTLCANAVQDIYAVIDQAQANPDAFEDKTWISEKNDALVLMGDFCSQLGWDSGIPSGYEQANRLLLETRSYFADFIEAFWEGVAAADIDAIQAARENLVEATELFTQAGEAIP